MKIYQNQSTDSLIADISSVTNQSIPEEINRRVAEIITTVQAKGDQALFDYSQQFDNVTLDTLQVAKATIQAAYNEVSPTVISALEKAVINITSFHEQEKRSGFVDMPKPGVIRGSKVTPLSAVGVYVPGGTAAYPSSVLMNVIPAKIAGVKRIVMVTPPQKTGIDPAVLVAADLAGVDEIYQIGGAQAIAALAYGTETIPQVDKITGPGNAYVAAAKRLVYGQVAIDMIAGPSEIGILADDSADANDIAADLLSQAEHDVLARAILVTNSTTLANNVEVALTEQLKTLPRKAIAQEAIDNRASIIIVPTIAEMFTIMNAIAPEHLEVQLPDPMQYLGDIQNAGSVFLGRYASEPLGDYLAGPNHILPTSGTSRFSSALSVSDFQKHIQFTQYDQRALQEDYQDVAAIARQEGLEAHARAVEQRFN